MVENSLELAAKRVGAVVLYPVRTKTHDHRMQIKSETSSALYTVAWSLSQHRWECSCRGWIRHRACKHLAAMVPTLDSVVRRPVAPTPRPAERPATVEPARVARQQTTPAWAAIMAIPSQGQSQESLSDQLTALHEAATRLGLYDAADYIRIRRSV